MALVTAGLFQSTHPSGVRLVNAGSRPTPVQISIHAPQWGATRTPPESRSHSFIFQSTHPSGVRLELAAYTDPDKEFQSTHPSGVRHLSRAPCGADDHISIHAPQWGATCPRRSSAKAFIFQSTHPSGVRPPVTFCNRVWYDISIHAPQWGATCREPAWRSYAVLISIHAPQWGATDAASVAARPEWYFNPRTPVGCDETGSNQTDNQKEFQSTHPSGVRPDAIPGASGKLQISIHAPQWGATIPEPITQITLKAFQSTHPSGVRRPDSTTLPEFDISIHAPQWGATIVR